MTPVAVSRRLPGNATPRAEVLREYEEQNAIQRQRIPAPLWMFWAPDPDELYRWRVQLDCGCIAEVLARGREDSPPQGRWQDSLHRTWLPAGQMFCWHDDSTPSAPYREIIEWGSRRELSFPADPVDPPDWADHRTWARIRCDEPRTSAFWMVTLTCGHVTEVVADLSWKPADRPRRVSATRLKEMRTEFDEYWASDPDGEDSREREHVERMLADGWPRPTPEQECSTCPHARFIVAYQRIGWLVPQRSKPPEPPSRDNLERRLHRAEAEADRLRAQLAQLDAPPRQA